MLEEIARAQASITIEAYIYWAGDIGRDFATRWRAKAREGIPVKILLDAVGSATIGTDILETLEKPAGASWPGTTRIHWYTIGRFNHRTHRKSLIIDGRVGFTGGAGIADVWLGHAQIAGALARHAGPHRRPGGDAAADRLRAELAADHGRAAVGADLLPGTRARAGDVDGADRHELAGVRRLHPCGSCTTCRSSCARQSIYIANPYFVPDQAAIDTLVEAKRRGVDVRIMVSGNHNDNWLARKNSVRLYGPLLEAGIEILEYNKTMLHQKTMVVDGAVGDASGRRTSTTARSRTTRRRASASRTPAGAFMEQTFRTDMRACDRVELEAWQKRGLVTKSLEAVASLLEAQV